MPNATSRFVYMVDFGNFHSVCLQNFVTTRIYVSLAIFVDFLISNEKEFSANP